MAQKKSSVAFEKYIVKNIDDINEILDKHNIFIDVAEKPNTIMLTIIRDQSGPRSNEFDGDIVFNINNINFSNTFPFNSKPFLHYSTVLRNGKLIKKQNEPWIGKKSNGVEVDYTIDIDDIQDFFYGRDPVNRNAKDLMHNLKNATIMLADGFIIMVKELESRNILDEMARQAGVDITVNPYQVLTNHLKRKALMTGQSNNIRIQKMQERKQNQNSDAAKVAKTTDLVPPDGQIIANKGSAVLDKDLDLGRYIGQFGGMNSGGKKRRRKKKSRRKRKSKKNNKRKTLKGKKKRRSRKR
jgi:hypothetical protein